MLHFLLGVALCLCFGPLLLAVSVYVLILAIPVATVLGLGIWAYMSMSVHDFLDVTTGVGMLGFAFLFIWASTKVQS